MTTRCGRTITREELDCEVADRLDRALDRPQPGGLPEGHQWYSLQVLGEGDPFRGDRTGPIWRCPRRAVVGTAGDDPRCRAHGPDAECEDIIAALVEAQTDGPEGVLAIDESNPLKRRMYANQLLGVEVDRLDLADVGSDERVPIDLRLSRIGSLELATTRLNDGIRIDGCLIGEATFRNGNVGGPITARAAVVDDSLDLCGCTVEGDVRAADALVRGPFVADEADLRGTMMLHDTDVRGSVSFQELTVGELLWVKESTVDGNLRCAGATVEADHVRGDFVAVHLNKTVVEGGIDLESVTCAGSVLANNLMVTAGLSLRGGEVGGSVWVGARHDDIADLNRAELGGSLDLAEASIRGEVDTTGSADGRYDGTRIGGVVDARGATVGTLRLAPEQGPGGAGNDDHPEGAVSGLDGTGPFVDGRGAEVDELQLDIESERSDALYDFTDATVGAVSFASDRIDLSEHVRFFRTDFEAFDSSQNRRLLDAGEWRIHEVPSEERLSERRAYADVEKLAIDAVFVCVTDPSVAELLAAASPPEPDRLLTAIIPDPDDVERASEDGPVMKDVPDAVTDRERFRRGLLTRLAEHVHKGSREDVTQIFADERCRARLRELAAVTADVDASPVRVATRPETVAAVQAFARAAARAVADPTDVDGTHGAVESTYLRARRGADAVGDTVAAGEFYMQELKARRKGHRERVRGREGSGGAVKDYVSNWVLWVTTGYGERPSHVFGSSVVVVAGFAVVFGSFDTLIGPIESPVYRGVIGYLLLSFESFIAFVLGGAAVESRLVRLLANIEGFLGAFLIGLFVFTLTRSIKR